MRQSINGTTGEGRKHSKDGGRDMERGQPRKNGETE